MKKVLFYSGCILLIIFLLRYANCGSKNASKDSRNLSFSNLDSVTKDIPYLSNHKPLTQYLLKDAGEKQEGFETLENGFDSLAIRITYEATIEPIGQVVELTKAKSTWNAQLFLIHYALTGPNKDSVIVVKKEVRTALPKSGWDTFINKLFNLQILTMKIDPRLSDSDVMGSGSGFVFQVATKNRYRYYFYYPIGINKDEFWQARKLDSALELIEKEFDFPRIE